MASFLSNFLHGVGHGDSIKDYRHASNLFTHDNFRLAPKFRYLYHCNIKLNRGIAGALLDQAEISFMVKTIELPSITFEVETNKQYNRKAYNLLGVDYAPISITFHDDNHNNVRNFLARIYQHYVNDGTKNNYSVRSGGKRHTYNERASDLTWGLDSSYAQSGGTNLIDEIQINSLSKGNATVYTLKNPVIASFSHGSHDVSDGAGPMESTIQVHYDAIVYGDNKAGSVENFGGSFYDRSGSVLSGGARGGGGGLFSPGGIFDKATDVFGNLQSGNLLNAAAGAFQLREQLRHNSTKDLLRNDISNSLPGITDLISRNQGNSFPTATLRRAQQSVREAAAEADVDSSGGGASGAGAGDGSGPF